MPSQKKRTYKSSIRDEQAKQTKKRILSSAKQLFQSKGFEGATIGEIAQEANISTPAIYSLFKSKRGILFALMDNALPSKVFEGFIKQINQEKSIEGRLQIAAKMTRQIYDAEQKQQGFLRDASIIGPEFKKIEKTQEERRYQRQEETINTMFKEGLLTKKLTLTQARDILWAFTGRDMYRLFVIARGWSSNEYEEWLTQLLIDNLTKV